MEVREWRELLRIHSAGRCHGRGGTMLPLQEAVRADGRTAEAASFVLFLNCLNSGDG